MSARIYYLPNAEAFVAECKTCGYFMLGETEILAGNKAAVHYELHHAPPIAKSAQQAPHIRPAVPPHSECRRQNWNERPRLGDVRQCRHGKLQVLSKVDVNSPVQGPGTNYWRDLSRIWDRSAYKAAARALGK